MREEWWILIATIGFMGMCPTFVSCLYNRNILVVSIFICCSLLTLIGSYKIK